MPANHKLKLNNRHLNINANYFLQNHMLQRAFLEMLQMITIKEKYQFDYI